MASLKEFSDVTAEKMIALRSDVTLLQEAVEQLQGELAAARRERSVYRGVWRRGRSHSLGDLVTDKGQLWHCWQAIGPARRTPEE